MRLPRSFYRRDAVTVARELLGQRLVRVEGEVRLAGIIVEVEAYLGVVDKAAHTCGGRRTARNASMWGDGGHLYVYFTYGMHHCMNVVASVADDPVAVLIRAIEPTEGLDVIRSRRHKARKDTDLCSGPAKLCQAFSVDRTFDGTDLVAGDVMFIERINRKPLADGDIVTTPRIGVAYAGEWALKPLRFCVKNSPHVSR